MGWRGEEGKGREIICELCSIIHRTVGGLDSIQCAINKMLRRGEVSERERDRVKNQNLCKQRAN
jgi:hypothetical protein